MIGITKENGAIEGKHRAISLIGGGGQQSVKTSLRECHLNLGLK